MPMSESYSDEAVDAITDQPDTRGSGLTANQWVMIYVALAFAGLFIIQRTFKGV